MRTNDCQLVTLVIGSCTNGSSLPVQYAVYVACRSWFLLVAVNADRDAASFIGYFGSYWSGSG